MSLLPKNIRSRIFIALFLAAGMLVPIEGGKYFLFSQALAQAPADSPAQISGSQGRVLEIGVRTLQRLIQMDPNLYLVDVREAEELTGPLGRIKQAVHVPLGEVLKNPGKFPRNKTLAFICRSGHRSRIAARAVAAKGRVAYSVEGGMLAWNKLTRPKAAPADTQPDRQKKKLPKERDGGSDSIEEDFGC